MIHPEWQKTQIRKIRPLELKNQLKAGDYYILDVRPLNFKRDTSFIKGTKLCPLVYLADRYQELPKNKKIVITDWAMKQSITAAKFLKGKGYQIDGVLKGGLERWNKEKLPSVERKPTGVVESLDK